MASLGYHLEALAEAGLGRVSVDGNDLNDLLLTGFILAENLVFSV